jgi:hypothetical protein
LGLKSLFLILVAIFILGSTGSGDLTTSWSDEPFSDYPTGPDSNGSQQLSFEDQQTSTQYTQYYSMDGMDAEAPPNGDNIAGAESFDIQGQEPSTLYFGGQQNNAVSYSQFQPYAAFTGGNTLWIKGTNSWSQYVQVPKGASLTLIAATPIGGEAYFYEIYPNGQKLEASRYYFSPYNRIHFDADTEGQHVLLFVIDNQASNSVIIDVQPYYPGPVYPGPTYPGPGQVTGNRAKINIISNSLTGYQVYLDDFYQFTEGEGGVPDGLSSFVVVGNANHKIAIKKGGYHYSQTRYFAGGREYTMVIG